MQGRRIQSVRLRDGSKMSRESDKRSVTLNRNYETTSQLSLSRITAHDISDSVTEIGQLSRAISETAKPCCFVR